MWQFKLFSRCLLYFFTIELNQMNTFICRVSLSTHWAIDPVEMMFVALLFIFSIQWQTQNFPKRGVATSKYFIPYFILAQEFVYRPGVDIRQYLMFI